MTRRKNRSDRGETLIEFAFASLIFFAIVFGIIEFGIAVWRYNLVADLAQEGARWASVRGADSGAVASSNDVQTFVQSRAMGLAPSVTTTWSPSSKKPGAIVTVTVQTNFTPGTNLIPHGTFTLRSSAQMVIAR
jgi:Flp pilus assembly protein TadG